MEGTRRRTARFGKLSSIQCGLFEINPCPAILCHLQDDYGSLRATLFIVEDEGTVLTTIRCDRYFRKNIWPDLREQILWGESTTTFEVVSEELKHDAGQI
jgi:hypothetical protein